MKKLAAASVATLSLACLVTPALATSKAGLTINSTKLGHVLADGTRTTLYEFDRDKRGRSACYGACAVTWSPYTVKVRPRAGTGVAAAKIGTVRRRDGKLQVTYAGHPLYLYAGDLIAGSTRGNGVNQYGEDWHAVRASGVLYK